MTSEVVNPSDRIDNAVDWVRLFVCVALVFLVFQSSAAGLASDRGQHGVLIAAIVVAATVAVERLAFGGSFVAAARAVGLGRPNATGMAAAGGVCMLLLLIPTAMRLQGMAVSLAPGWLALVPGLLAQGGIAEETLFRGFLFGHLRRGRPFWRAVLLAMPPFVAVHLFMFFTMPWPIASAAVLLSVVISIPLARLFDLGGSTIWAPALLHAVVQGTVKIVTVPAAAGSSFPIAWMMASAAIPMLVLAVKRR